MEGFAGLVGRGVARHGDRPLLTWYDDERSERVELSWRTFGNWVAKVANLLAGELGVAPGDRVGAVLVDHWQAATVLAGCWLAGAGVVAVDPGAAPHAKRAALAGCEAAFVREEWVAEVDGLPGPGRLVALTADLLGRGDRDLGGALPFARAVAAMPPPAGLPVAQVPGGPGLDCLAWPVALPRPSSGELGAHLAAAGRQARGRAVRSPPPPPDAW